jgi:glycosyltransferase involved in cell wall biosynthesis
MVRVVFAGLDAFSDVGGIQSFNRRQITNLVDIARERGWPAPRAILMGDDPMHVPGSVAKYVHAASANRARFVSAVLSAARAADRLILGHINLLPLACAAKGVNPRLRVVLFVHGDEVWNCARRPKRAYEPLFLRFVDRVASVSRYTAEVMSREFRVKPCKFMLFPNVVDAEPSTGPLQRSADTVLAVARLAPDDRLKNIDVLIRAVAELSRRGRPVRLEVVGDGALRPELEMLAQDLGVDAHVEFRGRLDDAALSETYRRVGVFALPSSQEGFGIVYLEAWRQRLPVICGTRGAACEIVSDRIDGLVCDETDVDDLADKIAYLVDNSDVAAEYGRRGYAKVRAAYSNEIARRNLLSLVTLTSGEQPAPVFTP